jgi:AraC-like DNA-binding protein
LTKQSNPDPATFTNGTSPVQPLHDSLEGGADHLASVFASNPRLIALHRIVEHRSFEYFRPLRRLKTLVESGYCEKITLRQAARAAGLEQKYLSTYFRKKVGLTFSTWLMVYRVCKSLQLMETEDLSITEISLSVGLDLRTFERWFGRLVGCTPRQHRNLVLVAMEQRDQLLSAGIATQVPLFAAKVDHALVRGYHRSGAAIAALRR